MRQLLLWLMSGLFFLSTNAQHYGNEWVDFNQEYYKIKVLQNGFHKVSHAELSAIGFPVSSVNPTELQLWYRGTQIAIEVKGEADGVFNTSDFIVFYGKKADALLETPMHYEPQFQLQKNYSMYSDTSYYYLTWSEGVKGKRVTNHGALALPQRLDTVHTSVEQLFTAYYSQGKENVEFIFKCEFDDGEGWMSNTFGYNTRTPTANFSQFSIPNLKGLKNQQAVLEIAMAGGNARLHKVRVEIGESNKVLYNVPEFSGFVNQLVKIPIGASQVQNDSLKIKISCFGDGVYNDLISLYYIKLDYSKDTKNIVPLSSEVYIAASTDKFIKLKSTASTRAYDVADLESISRFYSTPMGDSLELHLPKSNKNYQLFFADTLSYLSIHSAKKVDGFENDLQGANYLILTHELFMAGAQAYKAYRESEAGGNYKVHIVEIERVLDQYMYGEKNPLAIRNLLRYLIDNNQKPDYFFIIGDGARHNLKFTGTPYARTLSFGQKNANGVLYYENQDYIFTFGEPGWDLGFSAGLDGEDDIVPAIPTSRIASRSNADVFAYLNKVKEYENPASAGLWRKRFVHLSGGQNTSQQLSFIGMANAYSSVAEGPYVGGRATTYTKNTSNAVQFFNISKDVNDGVGMIAYMGHSSPDFLEIDLGFASEEVNGYRNKGKYPVLYFNGCYSGDIFQTYAKTQDWINVPDKGAIAAFAMMSYGYTSQLHGYTLDYYHKAYEDSLLFDNPVGLLHKNIIKYYLSKRVRNDIVRSQAQFLALLGDPAVRIFPYSHPDYVVERAKVSSYDGERVTAVSDTFKLDVVISNYGRVNQEPLTVCITRSFNSISDVIEYGPFEISPVAYQDTVSFLIPNGNNLNYAGFNRFKIKLDCTDSLPEEHKFNNELTYTYLLPENGVKTIYPTNFSIVGDSVINFFAQSFNLSIFSTLYDFQLDTTIKFATPVFENTYKAKADLKVENFRLPIVEDTTVYYWRAKLKTDTVWTLASFTYIPSTQGFGQFELDQFYDNKLTNLFRDTVLNAWHFDTSAVMIDLLVVGNQVTGNAGQIYLTVNGQALMVQAGALGCNANAIYLLAFDRVSALPYNPGGIAAGNCGVDPKLIYAQANANTVANQNRIIDYLSQLKDDDYLLVYTVGNSRIQNIGDSLTTILENSGASMLKSAINGGPYVLLTQKGRSEPLFENFSINRRDSIALKTELRGTIYEGTIWSPLIGPASHWNSYQDAFSLNLFDSVAVELYGVRFDFTDSLFWSAGSSTSHHVLLDIFAVDNKEFPYLKAKATVVDTANFTTPQLKYWSVTYEGVPEGTLVFSQNALGDSLEIFEGREFTYEFSFANISRADFNDSLEVEIKLTGERETQVWYQQLTPLAAGDTLSFVVSFSTTGWTGENLLQVFVNPYLQLEQDYSNNISETHLFVPQDFKHPILDVTVNGRHIKSGDWVENNPEILVSITDDNVFLPINDTTTTYLYFKNCKSCTYNRVYFSDERVSWKYTNGSLLIAFYPGELEDGVYGFRVNAEDMAGNKVAEIPYEIEFEIKNGNSLQIEGPYPNPSTGLIRFKLAVSGEVPQAIIVDVFNEKGLLMKQLTAADFTLLQVGKTGGLLEWDLKDDYGNKLSAGLYLYVISGLENHQVQGHKKGKLIILK